MERLRAEAYRLTAQLDDLTRRSAEERHTLEAELAAVRRAEREAVQAQHQAEQHAEQERASHERTRQALAAAEAEA